MGLESQHARMTCALVEPHQGRRLRRTQSYTPTEIYCVRMGRLSVLIAPAGLCGAMLIWRSGASFAGLYMSLYLHDAGVRATGAEVSASRSRPASLGGAIDPNHRGGPGTEGRGGRWSFGSQARAPPTCRLPTLSGSSSEVLSSAETCDARRAMPQGTRTAASHPHVDPECDCVAWLNVPTERSESDLDLDLLAPGTSRPLRLRTVRDERTHDLGAGPRRDVVQVDQHLKRRRVLRSRRRRGHQ